MAKIGEVFLKIPPVLAALLALGSAALFGAGVAAVGVTAVPSRLAAVEDSVQTFSEFHSSEIVRDSTMLCYLQHILEAEPVEPWDCRYDAR